MRFESTNNCNCLLVTLDEKNYDRFIKKIANLSYNNSFAEKSISRTMKFIVDPCRENYHIRQYDLGHCDNGLPRNTMASKFGEKRTKRLAKVFKLAFLRTAGV